MKVRITSTKFVNGATSKSSDNYDDDAWIRKILEFEAIKGSSTGDGLSNWGYNAPIGFKVDVDPNSKNYKKVVDKKTGALYHNTGVFDDAPKTIDEAVDRYKTEYLPLVSQYPAGVRERIGDYIYNTGRKPEDLLLYTAGKIDLPTINSNKDNNPTWQANKDEIQKQLASPDFINKLDTSKHDVYKTTNQVNGKANPSYDKSWKYRLNMFSPVSKKEEETNYNNNNNNMNDVNPIITKSGLQAKDNLHKGDKAYWTAAYQELNDKLIEEGKPGFDVSKMNAESYQNTLAKDFPELLLLRIKDGSIPLNNKHRKELGIDATSYLQLNKEQRSKIKDPDLISGFTDKLPGFRKVNLSADKFRELVNSAEFKAKTPEEQQAILTEGNKYSLDNSDPSKNNYKKQALPFQQTIPELAGFASALNTYNYQTPDYTHWEVTPNKLNIQPQLQSIDSSLNAVNATTTGNPQVDYARKVGAFTQGLAAKQQPFSNKQNYDSTVEFEAQKINNPARTQEQYYDVNAMNTIYNEYMPEAKDAASTERIKAISSLSKKYALNEANESKKKLMLDNFYKNVRVGKDGYLEMIDKYNLPEEYYKEDAVVPPTLPTTAMVKPISGFTASPNNKMPFTVANPNAPAPPTYFNNRRPTTLNKPVILNKPGYVKPKGSPMILDDTTPMFVGGGRVRRK